MSNILKCPACDSQLMISYGYTGADWECEKGEGSGYKYEVSLQCTTNACARSFTLGHLKDYADFSEVKNGKPYLTQNSETEVDTMNYPIAEETLAADFGREEMYEVKKES